MWYFFNSPVGTQCGMAALMKWHFDAMTLKNYGVGRMIEIHPLDPCPTTP